MSRRIYLILALPLLLLSCSRSVVSSDHHDLPEQGWTVPDTLMLTLQVPDTTRTYDLALTLRHTDRYTYQNLWLFVQACDTLSPLQRDTVMACLADDRGQWLGTRAGRYYSGYVLIHRDLSFPATGDYTFAIVHGMRDSVVTGIADIGLELRIANPK